MWNPALSLPGRKFEFWDTETARIRAALQACESFAAGTDRRWLQPLVDALFPSNVATA
jgi:hypothetical protein